MHSDQGISIWFFIGSMLAIYGVLIFGSGLYSLAVPPPESQRVALWNLHADIWWGAIMAVIGAVYCVKFKPVAKQA